MLLPKTLLVFRMLESISRALRSQSVNIVRLCSHKYEYAIAYRIRKGQQLFTHYTKLWEDRAIREVFNRMRTQFHRHRKELLFGATGAYVFDWEKDRIPMEKILTHLGDIEYSHYLLEKSLVCGQCKKRKLIDVMVPGITYCDCSDSGLPNKAIVHDNWQPFIERKDLIVWRKKVNCGMFAYKVFGKYDDVYAEDFLHVQTDIKYRKEWDTTAISLEIADSDPHSNSHIIYWEMLWPRLFANRDYVYNRRCHLDEESQVIVIVSESTTHPLYPQKTANHRVSEYWSYLVIKPTRTLKECGIEFVLTYYDNPGVSIPSAITSWVAMNGMPEFLSKLRKATLDYATLRKLQEKLIKRKKCKQAAVDIPDPGMEYPPDYIPIRRINDFDEDNDDDSKATSSSDPDLSSPRVVHDNNPPASEVDTEEPVTSSSTSHSWWSYLHPYYYFA